MDGANDLAVGTVYAFGEYLLTEQEIVDFARAWDPQDQHLDPNPAHQAIFGGVIASGMQTLAVAQRLCVATLYRRWKVIAGRGLRDVLFLAPVRPGDVLTGSARIDELTVDERRGRGDVAIALVITVADKPVLTATVDIVLEA